MTTVSLTPVQEELIRSSARKCDFKDFDIVASTAAIKGDNYLGIIYKVTVKERDEGKVLHLILKCAHTNEMFRKEAPIAQCFEREARIYSTIVPKLVEHQKEKAISQPFTGHARYYGSRLDEGHETILMENLKEYGYDLWDRKTPMDDAHIALVFAEYARFHAASLGFKANHPEEFDALTSGMELSVFEKENADKFEAFMAAYFQGALKATEGRPKARAVVEKIRDNFKELSEKQIAKDKLVVLHGDCWCNNMLFKYKDDKRTPEKVCFIDWQLSKLGSPAKDLAYFFCVCGSKETFQNYEKYLSLYYKILSQNLQEFGCDPEVVFSRETLMEDWRNSLWHGVFMAIMIIKLMVTDSEEVPDVQNMSSENDLMKSFTDFESSKSSEFNRRFCDVSEFVAEIGVLS